MESRRAIARIPENQPLTTQRAAGLLRISRPHLIKLLDNGVLPYHNVGSHRRIYHKDLIAYQKRSDDMERKAALGRIAKGASLVLLGHKYVLLKLGRFTPKGCQY